MTKQKITVIGGGNIGGATAIGLWNACREHVSITVTAKHAETLAKFCELGMAVSLDNREAASGADIVILAVKPWLMEEVVTDLIPALDLQRQTIVSMAPGIASADLLCWLGGSANLAYVIPNTAIAVGESMTFVVPVSLSEERTEVLKNLFGSVGSALVVEEQMLRPGTSLASCGIAYALRYIGAAANGGEALGFSGKDSLATVCQTVRGALAILEANGSAPEEEIDKVTTPGGMTLRGLGAMEDNGFSKAVAAGLEANK